jgi:2-C-methyl-D-erythritol 4-phosphate cytidylyltransferase/2-C-methyl-D-erythritol 2,4-cyclodiphosphate synthase
MSIGVIIAAGGHGQRLGGATPKQFLAIGEKSLLARSIEAFRGVGDLRAIVVVLPADHVASAQSHIPPVQGVEVRVVAGGARRQDSVAAGLDALPADVEIVLVHDAARPFVTTDVIARTVAHAREHGAAVAAVNARDTVKRGRRVAGVTLVDATLPREEIFLAQTPQGFRRDVLEAAVELGQSGMEATDEARLAELAGFDVVLVEGDPRNLKVTTEADLAIASALAGSEGASSIDAVESRMDTRIGFGYDSHRLVTGRPLILGGVRLPSERGLAGHSDADAVAHSVTDAILGAVAAGDIGQMFPDTDPRWCNADSLELLRLANQHVNSLGYRVCNVDVTVIAEAPRLAGYREAMRAHVAGALGIAADRVSIKAKTNEQLGSLGRGEGIAAHAVALVGREER